MWAGKENPKPNLYQSPAKIWRHVRGSGYSNEVLSRKEMPWFVEPPVFSQLFIIYLNLLETTKLWGSQPVLIAAAVCCLGHCSFHRSTGWVACARLSVSTDERKKRANNEKVGGRKTAGGEKGRVWNRLRVVSRGNCIVSSMRTLENKKNKKQMKF